MCVCEEAGYTRGTEDKKYIYIVPEAPTTVAYRMKKKPMEKGKTTSLYTRTLSTTTRKEKKKQLQGSTYGEHGAEKENKHRCKIECRQQVWHTSNQVEGTRGLKTAKEDDLCFCANLLFFFPTLSLPRLNRSYVGFVPFFPYQKYGRNMLFSCNTECSK